MVWFPNGRALAMAIAFFKLNVYHEALVKECLSYKRVLMVIVMAEINV